MDILKNKSCLRNGNNVIYQLTFTEFVGLIKKISIYETKWSFNREISELHAEEIKSKIVESIKEKKTFSFYNSLKFVNQPDTNTLKLIDGQHRFKALEKLINEYPIAETDLLRFTADKEPTFILEVYFVKNIRNNEEINEIFSIINNVYKVDNSVIKQQKVIRLIGYLSNEPLWQDKTGNSYLRENTKRPYLSINRLRDALLENKFYDYISDDKDIKNIIEEFKKINKDLLTRTVEHFTKGKKADISMLSAYNRAKEMKFFLGLDKSCKYISEIVENLQPKVENDEYKVLPQLYSKLNLKNNVIKYDKIKKIEMAIKKNLDIFREEFSVEVWDIEDKDVPKYFIEKYIVKL